MLHLLSGDVEARMPLKAGVIDFLNAGFGLQVSGRNILFDAEMQSPVPLILSPVYYIIYEYDGLRFKVEGIWYSALRRALDDGRVLWLEVRG